MNMLYGSLNIMTSFWASFSCFYCCPKDKASTLLSIRNIVFWEKSVTVIVADIIKEKKHLSHSYMYYVVGMNLRKVLRT